MAERFVLDGGLFQVLLLLGHGKKWLGARGWGLGLLASRWEAEEVDDNLTYGGRDTADKVCRD